MKTPLYILAAVIIGLFIGFAFLSGGNVWDAVTLGAISYPTSLDTFTNPGATDSVATVSHSGQHSNANDAIEALEAKVGIQSSTPLAGSVLVSAVNGASFWSTYATTTFLYAQNLITTASSTVVGDFTVGGNTTLVNATSTALFSTTASSTNLFAAAASFGTLSASKLATLSGGALVNNSTSTITNLVTVNATSTSATSTAFFSTTASSSQLFAGTGNFNSIITNSCTGCGALTNALTLVPNSVFPTNATSSFAYSSNTTMWVGQVIIDAPITVNKITIRSGDAVSVAGTVDLTLYSEDGQTQVFSVTTASISAAKTFYTTAVSSVAVDPGIYYIAFNTNSTANVELVTQSSVPNNNVWFGWDTVTSEPTAQGSVTISAGAPPATITPDTDITANVNAKGTLMFRLDN